MLFHVLDSAVTFYCFNLRVPAAGVEVASRWEASVWIVQSDHGAKRRRTLFFGCGWFGAFWLWDLRVQGQQQTGRSNVLCQTESGDVTVRETTSDFRHLEGDSLEVDLILMIWWSLDLDRIWVDCYSPLHKRLLTQFQGQEHVLWFSITGIMRFGYIFPEPFVSQVTSY